jgi:SAM-dependent methyltransferase
MPGEIDNDSLYDHPAYYDLVYGSDSQAELQFLLAAFDRFAGRKVRRVFEPACGTGRLLIRLAQRGLRVAGNDLNPRPVRAIRENPRAWSRRACGSSPATTSPAVPSKEGVQVASKSDRTA